MATPFSAVYDQALMLIKDYRLIELYNASATDFETYLQGWLIPAIQDFKNCDQSLLYEDGSFAVTLTDRNIVILAKLMLKYWLKKELDDITQMNLHISDRDFKIYSEAMNMAEKRKRYDTLREELAQELTEYSLDSINWSNWLSGTFYVP